MTLRETIEAYRAEGKGLAHFNFSDSNQLKAIAESSKETGIPVIAGLSEGEREYFPISHARALIDVYRSQGIEIFLNADHTYGIEKTKAAIMDGVDSVVVDGAKLPFEENLALLTEAVSVARASGRDVLVEGELGYIGSSSKVMDALPEGAAATEELMTKPEELADLVKRSGIDLVAPAVGNIHGLIKGGQPKLSISRIGTLSAAAGVPLVLHGGSGSPDEEFQASVRAGMVMIHINTDLRLLYKESLTKSLTEHPEETTPYKFLTPAVDAMKTYLMQKMKLFALVA